MRIILLHGLFMHRLIMTPMAKRLKKLGWEVENLSYPSTSTDKRRLFNTFDKIISDGPVLMVGHSLGGLVIKNYLATRKVSADKVPLVITIGTPHQGAEIAKDMDKFNIQKLLGSSVQFGLLPEQFESSWHLPQKLISIAGNVKLGARPLLDRVWRDGVEESDGTVSIAETKVQGMHEHIVVRQTHTSMVYSKSVVQLIDKYAQMVKSKATI